MVAIVPYAQDVNQRAVTGDKQRAVTDGFGQDIGEGVRRVAGATAEYAEVWKRQQTAQNEASALELDTGFADEARKIETGFLALQGRNALDARETTVKAYKDLEDRYTGMAQNEEQRGMLSRVLSRRRDRFDSAASGHLVRETETYRSTAATARIASLGTDLVTIPDGPDRLAGIQALRNEIDTETARKGLDASVADTQFLEQISGVHQATFAAINEAGDPHAAQAYLDRWEPQIKPALMPELRETARKQVDLFDARTMWDAEPERPAPTVTAEVEGTPITVTLRPPVATQAGSGFGPRRSPGGVGSSDHKGVDFPVPPNTPVTASAPGIVRWRNDPDGYGRYAVIDHGNGLETRYAHLGSAGVAEGTRVDQGDVIGMSGGARGANGAGNSQGPHVHYEVRRNGEAVNPNSQLGRNVTVRPGSSTVDAAAMPQTLEDVYELADARAGGDWRRREVFRAEGVRRFQESRAIRADAESEAERALQPYLPGGEKEVTSVGQIPASVLGAVDPATRRAASLSIENAQNGEAGIDMERAYDTYNALLDEAATNPQAFQARGELTQYRGILTNAQISSLRGTRRSLVTGGPSASDAVKQADDVFKEYAEFAGIDMTGERTVEDAEREANLRSTHLMAVQNWQQTHNGQLPTREETVRMLRSLTRPVTQDANGNGRRAQVARFEATSTDVQEVISSDQRTRAVASLRRLYPNVRTFTDEQIAVMHRRLITTGN